MGSNEVKIPTINFCKKDLKPGTSQWEATKEQVFKALEEYGCFEAIYDKVPNEIREALFENLKHTLLLKTKLKEYLDKPYHRYEGKIPHFPFRDKNVHAADLLIPESIESFANTFWEDGNPNFCNVVKSYSKSLVELDEMVKRMVLESLGLEDYLDEFFEFSNVYILRFAKYFKAVQNEGNSKLASTIHTDASFFTIIEQAQAGLQVLSKNGEWIEPKVSPNSYIILSSDALVAWTNGRLHSAIHKVMMGGDADRFSIQQFTTLKPGHVLKAPKELVNEDNPLRFKPFDISEFYNHVRSGAKSGLLLQDYIGV